MLQSTTVESNNRDAQFYRLGTAGLSRSVSKAESDEYHSSRSPVHVRIPPSRRRRGSARGGGLGTLAPTILRTRFGPRHERCSVLPPDTRIGAQGGGARIIPALGLSRFGAILLRGTTLVPGREVGESMEVWSMSSSVSDESIFVAACGGDKSLHKTRQ